MKKLWLAVALLFVVPSAMAQDSVCKTQIQIANAIMEELQEQVQVMSVRAAQHYGNLQVLSAELAAANVELTLLRNVEK